MSEQKKADTEINRSGDDTSATLSKVQSGVILL